MGSLKENIKPTTVDSYIANAAPEAQPLLHELRKIIKAAVPQAEESISWNVPFYKYNGPLAGFSVFKKHASFGIAKGILEPGDSEALERQGYKTGIRTIQIGFGQKPPAAIIRRILKTQLKKEK